LLEEEVYHISQEARERVAAEAAYGDQWDLVMSTVETGVSIKMRDELTEAAAACGQWTCGEAGKTGDQPPTAR
jgi:hypothetical protein